MKNDKKEIKDFTKKIKEDLTIDLLAQFSEALRKKYKITINDDVIDQLNKNGYLSKPDLICSKTIIFQVKTTFYLSFAADVHTPVSSLIKLKNENTLFYLNQLKKEDKEVDIQ